MVIKRKKEKKQLTDIYVFHTFGQTNIFLKTIATMPSQTQNFLIFWLLILDSKNFQIIF